MVSPNGSRALIWDAERLRIATDAAGIALWSWNLDTDGIALDRRAHGLWAVPVGNTPATFEALSARIHPQDVDRVRAAFTNTRTILGLYEIDFRVVDGDEVVRWISARGEGAEIGIVDRVMFGVFMDVTDRKQIEETREMLAGEMSHRVKNLFALASALTGIAARSAATTTEMANDLTVRLTALGRAHSLVRPTAGEKGKALLGDLLDVLLAPYGNDDRVGDRITFSVAEIRIGEATATTIALVVHELATNSAKYGALSNASGILDVSCSVEGDDVVMLWTEQGGPVVSVPSGPMGFGSKLIARTVSGELGGSIAFDWRADGVVVTLRMNKARLER